MTHAETNLPPFQNRINELIVFVYSCDLPNKVKGTNDTYIYIFTCICSGIRIRQAVEAGKHSKLIEFDKHVLMQPRLKLLRISMSRTTIFIAMQLVALMHIELLLKN